MFFYLPKLIVFFLEIGNNPMRALGRKNRTGRIENFEKTHKSIP